MPISRPAAAVMPNDVKRANSTAPSAGTTCSGSVVASSWTTDDASTPKLAATTAPSTVLTSESSRAPRPARIADTSFSLAARVARPKRV